jgi:hypothetical protein
MVFCVVALESTIGWPDMILDLRTLQHQILEAER